MEQDIRFCTTSDGVRVAYAATGSGYPLVWVPGWLSHAEIDWDYPILGERYHALTKDFMLLRLDKRGTGLSARNVGPYSREAWVRDVEAVVAHAGLERFALAGYSEGGPVAVEYATLHPDRVSHLILMGTGVLDEDDQEGEVLSALVTIIRRGWGSAVKLMSDTFLGDGASADAQQAFAAYQLQAANAADAADMMAATRATFGIRHIAPNVRAPTLLIHARSDRAVPIENGQQLAALIPGAAFKSVEGHHVPNRKQSAQMEAAIREFVLGVEREPAADEPAQQTGMGVQTVLFTDLVAHTEMMQRLGDEKGRDVLREHERITRETLQLFGGAEVKTMGDGFMASFSSVTRALDCAIALQRRFDRHNSELPDSQTPLRVRVGLNAGEPIAEDGDLFGSTVILASRIAAQAGPGEILIPEPLRHLLFGKSYVYSDRGDVALKGFEDAVRLYEVQWREA
jgi:class 3 adenylate cyclase/alpha-beta hydrolase superfamily lysophospholipase